MTPKERTDAIRELKDMAMELEAHRSPSKYAMAGEIAQERGERYNRAALLRAVAAELARGAE